MVNLNKYRKLLGYSKSYVAKQLSVSPLTVVMWELGIKLPDEENIDELSKLLCVSKDTLTADDENLASCKKLNDSLLAINVLVALFCMTVFIALWRFSPSTIPAHWTGKTIDRYGNKAELFFHLITISIYFITDLIAYFPLKAEGSKSATCVCHGVMIFLQLGYSAAIVGMYIRYLKNILPFAICLCSSALAFFSLALNPKIVNTTLGTKNVTKSKALFTASCILSTVFFIIYILSIIPIFPFE